jgi:hypothetical protein
MHWNYSPRCETYPAAFEITFTIGRRFYAIGFFGLRPYLYVER